MRRSEAHLGLGTLNRLTRRVRPEVQRLRIATMQPLHSYLLRRLINDKRVLIIGSGPSARDLAHIPEDVLVFGCNMSPQALLYSPNPGRAVDLYIGNIEAFRCYGGSIEQLLRTIPIRYFLSRDPKWVRAHSDIVQPHYVLRDRSTTAESYYLKRLGMHRASPLTGILRSSRTPWTSTGIALLQYALVYGAQEIYLIGIDLDCRGYAFTPGTPVRYQSHHMMIDHAVAALCAHRHQHIFCASPYSPLTRLFPHRSVAS
jgi:hypothetical protein